MTYDRQGSKSGKPLSQEDALKAMAGGREPGTPLPPGGAASDQTHAEGIRAAADLADYTRVSIVPTPTAAQARKPPPQAAAAQTFKKLMIPLLIVVGGLLLLMGGAVVILDATGTLKGASQSGPLGGPLGAVLVYSAFPLGIILLAGAWLFHRELK